MDVTRADRDGRPWWRRWSPVAGGTLLGVVAALPLAAWGWLAFGIAGAPPNLAWGTSLWALSGGALAMGVAVPEGPARRPRIVVGVLIAAAWFWLGRFIYGPV